ncbi:MAG: recombinase family protein [Burkholderiales bacterium]|nr:recombinase family protein [Burkholderiales bacterium]
MQSAPEFQGMLAAAKRREFQVLLVHNLDRFGRNREDAVVYKSLLRRQGIQVRGTCQAF